MQYIQRWGREWSGSRDYIYHDTGAHSHADVIPFSETSRCEYRHLSSSSLLLL